MTRIEQALLTVLRSVVHKGEVSDLGLASEEWEKLLLLAQSQELLPLIYDNVYSCQSFRSLSAETSKGFREKALQLAMRQIVQSNEFLTLILHAQALGLDPVVLKGITVRSLYPRPMLRPSVDEDLLISPEGVEEYHRFFLSEGLEPDDPDADLAMVDELSYHKPNSPTYIEMHMKLFSSDSEAYGDCNRLFEGALNRDVSVPIEDVTVKTLAPTDHLLYLLCHAYKHFLHSGVGIRQVCDIGIYTEKYLNEIEWERILSSCKSIRIELFAAALFRIAEKHLGFTMPEAFAGFEVDEQPLLEDILSGGAMGTADEDRLHSGTITLDAVAAQKSGRNRKGLIKTLFPAAGSLAGRYPYLRKAPWLLPVAWIQRIFRYLKRKDVKATESVRIGTERVALLKQYNVID